ncbi:MAG: chemotaxis protein CheW [Rhodothermales bacterium]
MDEQDELVKEFLIESFEYLDSLDEDLLTLEKESPGQDLLARIFRALHTIKGTGGFLDFDNLVSVAHAGEGLLDCLRKGIIEPSDEIASSLFDLVDAIREVLQSIEETGRDGEKAYAELVKTLVSLQGGNATPAPAKPASEDTPAPTAEVSPQETESENNRDEKPTEPATGNAEEEDDELGGYVKQMRGLLADINGELADFPLNRLDTERINRIQKSSKKIAGSSSIMGYRKLISVVISLREKLENIISGETTLSPETILLFSAHVDAAETILANIERSESEEVVDFTALINECHEKRKSAPVASPEAETPDATPQKLVEATNNAEKGPATTSNDSKNKTEAPAQTNVASPASEQTRSSKNTNESSKSGQSENHKRSLSDNNIRVNVDLLDALMNLVGELVLTRNQILQFTSAGNTNPAFANSAQNLDLITTELQEGVMKTRMQTIGTIWKKFPRVVRDLAKACNKKAVVLMEGEDTELDKTIIEAIKDPLTHLIRNSVDHGLESPENRKKAGKSEVGNIFLRAYHEGGHVNIEIGDDGAGINPEKIKNNALASGVITQVQAARMSDREILNLIFVSGLSTAKKVSNISGRGVGMDVVKTYIERIGGTVDINSKMGQGTSIKIKIPLTLAIIPALIIKVAEERFALPQVNLLELVRLEGDQIYTEIEQIHDTPVYRLRGKLLPLVYLSRELGLEEKVVQSEEEEELAVINIVVLQAEDHPFGLVVNEVVDTEEVVVKPLSKLLKHTTTFAGATIMGDGKIALILDVAGLARKGGIMSQDEQRRSKPETTQHKENEEIKSLLLARVNEERQIAIPLSKISRLEEIETASIEKTGNQEIVQYRNRLMPLIRLTRLLQLPPSKNEAANEVIQVVVCAKNGVDIGMVVDEIVDIVEERVTLQDLPGIVKSVSIIQKKATDLLSVQQILDTLDTEIFETPAKAALTSTEA